MNLNSDVRSLRDLLLFKVSELVWKKTFIPRYDKGNFKAAKRELGALTQILPNNLIQDIKKNMRLCEFETTKFLRFQQKFSTDNDFIFKSLSNVHWTMRHTVDIKNTIGFLINDRELSLKIRYGLACECCLESEILTLWNEMSDQQKSHYLSVTLQRENEMNIVAFWSMHSGGKQMQIQEMAANENFECISEYAFYHSSCEGNKEAARYFWSKADHSKRIGLAFRSLQAVGRLSKQVAKRFFYTGELNKFPDYTYFSEIIWLILTEIGSEINHMLLDDVISFGIYFFFTKESNIHSWDPILWDDLALSPIFSNLVMEVCVHKQLLHKGNYQEKGLYLYTEMFQLLSSLHKDKIPPLIDDYFNIFLEFMNIEGVIMVLNYCNPEQLKKLEISRENMTVYEDLVTEPGWNFLTNFTVKYNPKRRCYSLYWNFK